MTFAVPLHLQSTAKILKKYDLKLQDDKNFPFDCHVINIPYGL